MRPVLGVVVVSFGSATLLERNLPPACPEGAIVVVVDNYRSARSQDDVSRQAERHGWTMVASDDNPGFGAGANLGVRRALELGCDEVVLLNPDLRVDLTTVEELADEVRRRPDTLVAPRITRPDGTPWFTGAVVDREAGWTRNVPHLDDDTRDAWVTGACLGVSASLWQRLGGFDERYFLYWEDVDLSWRCLLGGGRVVVRADLVAVHEVGGTQRGVAGGKSPVYYRYNCRNRLLFAALHLTDREQRRWLARTPAYARRVLLRGGRRHLIRHPRPLLEVGLGSVLGAALLIRASFRTRP